MAYEKVCPGCGITFRTDRDRQVFCSHKCSSTNRSMKCGMAHCDTSLNWKKINGVWVCPYKEEVGCTFRRCDVCGWNPEVAKARLDKIMGVT